jgi:hypothetical protein
MHNYGSWTFINPEDRLNATALQAQLRVLAKDSDVMLQEGWGVYNNTPGWDGITPESIRALNKEARIYQYWSLMTKPAWDTESPTDDRRACPLSRIDIDRYDWYLRDGNGNKVREPQSTYIDVGKPGVKEAYLTELLSRLKDKGFDGVVFDIWFPRWLQQLVFDAQGIPMPAAYPTDDAWYSKAWKPFITHVCNGLHSEGYKIIGNSVGFYGQTCAEQEYQRSLCDGAVCERFIFDWSGKLLPTAEIEKVIMSATNDPLDLWILDTGLEESDLDFAAKMQMSYAAYLLTVPIGDAPRQSFGCPGTDWPKWYPIYGLDIGGPKGIASHEVGRNVWTRPFDNGVVWLNLENEPHSIKLLGKYRDVDDNILSGTIMLQPHDGLVMKRIIVLSAWTRFTGFILRLIGVKK